MFISEILILRIIELYVVVEAIFSLWAHNIVLMEWSFGDLLILIPDGVLAVLIGLYCIVHAVSDLRSRSSLSLILLLGRFLLDDIQ